MVEKRKLGDILISAGIITKEQLEHALKIQRETGEKLGKILVKEGFVTPKQIIEVLEFQLGIPHIDFSKFFVDPEAVKLVPESVAKKYILIPVKKEKDSLFVAMSDPLNIFAIDDVALITKLKVKPLIAYEEEILEAIDRFYGKTSAEEAMKDFEKEYESVNQDDKNIDEIKNAPAVRLVNSILEQAVKSRASDVHIEPFERDIRIRFRIDGQLQDIMHLEKHTLGPIITRIKIMANLNIAEKRLPQDGRIELKVNGKNLDLRISVLPTIYGEKTVIRILDKGNFIFKIGDLGLSEKNLKIFENLLKIPYGLILITGPTGSGKTTTLYTMLNYLNTVSKNIITVEDPVEYSIDGINQVQVNEKVGLTFANALRSILRQDPNIIMIGEIRDRETAEIAIRSAITGHLVLSTLHTNDAASSVTRLIDMGIEPYLVSSSLMAVIAQRLVRRICNECKEGYIPSEHELKYLGVSGMKIDRLYRGKGCPVCNKTGYKGRTAVHEIMEVTKEHRELINNKASSDVLKELSLKNGMETIRNNCVDLVLKGITTVEEFVRVWGMED